MKTRHLLLALCLLAGLESAASACSCVRKMQDEAGRRAFAVRIASEATALVEVELISPYDAKNRRGERLRVRRVLAGRAGPTVEVERIYPPHGAACAILFRSGHRRVITLAPPLRPDRKRPLHSIANSCTAMMLADPAIQQAVIAAMRERGRTRP